MPKISINSLNPLRKIVSRELVAVAFGFSHLKLAHLRVSPSKKEIIHLLYRDISTVAEEELPKVISSAIGELKAESPEIINIVPSHLVITKNIEIPSTNPQEIKEIINLQAGRHTPYSREEILVDYIEIGTYKHSYTKILLVIVARNVVEKQSKTLSRAGLRLKRVVFAPESLAWGANKILRLESETLPLNIVHIDEDFTDFTIVHLNKVVFIRSISIGTRHLTEEKEKYEAKFAEEIQRSLEAYHSEDIEKRPNMLVLTGAVQELGNLETILSDTLHLPVKTIPYLRNLLVSDEVAKEAYAAKRVSFLDVIAPLLADNELKVDLNPEEAKLRLALEERGRDLIKTGILVLTAFVMVFSILISKIYFKSNYLKILSAKYEPLNRDAEKLEKEFVGVSRIKDYLMDREFPLEVLVNLYTVANPDLELNDIRYDEQGKFSVKGTAETMSTVFSFVDALEKSKYFKDVKTRYTTKRKEGAREVADFEINMVLER
jgi:Tfp pilus assembly PilM family ATPase